MKAQRGKYQQLVQQIREQIEAEAWQPGEKLPSLRQQVELSGMSLMTVMHAYQVLESQGWIVSRPQSGYFVAPRAEYLSQPASHQPVQLAESVDINSFIFEVLQAARDPQVIPFGSAFPDPELFPMRQLMRSLSNVSHHLKPSDALNNLRPAMKRCVKRWHSAMRSRALPCRRMRSSSPTALWKR